MLSQWNPPIAIPTSTGPAPGTGYETDSSSWWKDPLGDLFEGATEKLRDELGIRDESDVTLELEQQPAQRAGIAGTGLTMTELLLWGGFIFGGLQLALNYAAVRKPRRRR